MKLEKSISFICPTPFLNWGAVAHTFTDFFHFPAIFLFLFHQCTFASASYFLLFGYFLILPSHFLSLLFPFCFRKPSRKKMTLIFLSYSLSCHSQHPLILLQKNLLLLSKRFSYDLSFILVLIWNKKLILFIKIRITINIKSYSSKYFSIPTQI